MRDAIAGNAPGRSRHGVLPQVSALIRLRWPVLSRRLLITAGALLPPDAALGPVVGARAVRSLDFPGTPPPPGGGHTRPGNRPRGFPYPGGDLGPPLGAVL